MDLGAALLAILTAVVVKGTVMSLTGFMVVRVYHATHERAPKRLWQLVPIARRPEAPALFYALIFFAISELTCGIEVFVLTRSSVLLEAFHAITSATGMALFSVGLYRYLDRKVIRFGEPGCVAHRICRTCTVREPAGCKMRLTTLLLASLVVVAALLPLLASTDQMEANLHRFALPLPTLNAWYDHKIVPWLTAHAPSYSPSGAVFIFPSIILKLELRVIPLVAALLAIASIAYLRRDRLSRGMDLLLLAAGALGYSYFELLLFRGTGDLMIGSLGHEVGELWFLVFTVEFLKRCFPSQPEQALLTGP